MWLSGPSGKGGPVLEDGEGPGSVALALSPGTRLVSVSWDVAEWRPERGLPSRRSGRLAVWRAGAGTGVEWLEDASGAVLASMSPGARLSELCELAGALGMSSEQVTRAFGHWAGRGWVVRTAL